MKGSFLHFLIALAASAGFASGFSLGGFLDSLLEDSEESLGVEQRLPALKNRSGSSQDAEQRPEKPSPVEPSRQPHQQLHRVDYTENIFERVLSGRVINELLSAISDCIGDSGIFDFLNPSEEEIDLNDNATQGPTTKRSSKASTAVTQPTTNNAPETSTAVSEITTKKVSETSTRTSTMKVSETTTVKIQPTTEKVSESTTVASQTATKASEATTATTQPSVTKVSETTTIKTEQTTKKA